MYQGCQPDRGPETIDKSRARHQASLPWCTGDNSDGSQGPWCNATLHDRYFKGTSHKVIRPCTYRRYSKCSFSSVYYGNPHSRTHTYGWESEAAVEKARGHVADLIGADPKEIIFTSGATESNNISVKGVARYWTIFIFLLSHLKYLSREQALQNLGGLKSFQIKILGNVIEILTKRVQWNRGWFICRFYKSKKNHVVTTQTEHKCVLDSCRQLENEGFEVTYLPVQKSGLIDLAQLEECLKPTTSLVSIMTVSFFFNELNHRVMIIWSSSKFKRLNANRL